MRRLSIPVAVALTVVVLARRRRVPDVPATRNRARHWVPCSTASDRRALDAVPMRRGAGPPPADPAVDFTDPQAVARTYLAAARSATPDDRDRTRLRAAAYAAPRSPTAAVGVVVLDPPPPGQVRTAAVTALDLVAAAEDDAAPRIPGHRRDGDRSTGRTRLDQRHDRVRGARPTTGRALAGRGRRTRAR